MRIIKRFFYHLKKGDIKATIQRFIQKQIGIDYEEISTLQYFMNLSIDASSIPPSSDPWLRIMQIADAKLLAILKRCSDKHGIKFWLDFGTLLGAKRHSGFIPWDDDLDIAVARSDYDKLLSVLKDELTPLGFDVVEEGVYRKIGVGYKELQTGLWCDIFPVEIYPCSKNEMEQHDILLNKMNMYYSFYKKKYNRIERHELDKKRKTIISSDGSHECALLYHGPEFKYPKPWIHDYCDIFPLSTIKFEGFDFYAPNNVHSYLSKIYGSDYMKLPKKGILHHGGENGKQSDYARLNNTDMDQILKELDNCINTL